LSTSWNCRFSTPKYRNEDTGRLAYDPAILLKIILFAYFKGITSSRKMHWCCETNIIFKALSCDTVPHFTTLAKFVSSHGEEIGIGLTSKVACCNTDVARRSTSACRARRPPTIAEAPEDRSHSPSRTSTSLTTP
jgi:hypothetical protein